MRIQAFKKFCIYNIQVYNEKFQIKKDISLFAYMIYIIISPR